MLISLTYWKTVAIIKCSQVFKAFQPHNFAQIISWRNSAHGDIRWMANFELRPFCFPSTLSFRHLILPIFQNTFLLSSDSSPFPFMVDDGSCRPAVSGHLLGNAASTHVRVHSDTQHAFDRLICIYRCMQCLHCLAWQPSHGTYQKHFNSHFQTQRAFVRKL